MFKKVTQRLNLAAQVFLHGALPEQDVSRQIPGLTAEEVAEAKTFFPMEKFFIFGHGRSGTTLLMRLIRLHPQVHCNRQAHFFTRPPFLSSLVSDPQVTEWLTRPSNRWNRGGDLSAVAMRAVSDYILERDARKEGKVIVGDKSPNDIAKGQAVQLLQAIYPDARLIFIVRDGRDAALSRRVQSIVDSVQQLNKTDLAIRDAIMRDPEPFNRAERSIFTPEMARFLAESWAENVSETHRLGQELYRERYCWLRYEDMLANPVDELMRLWGFLGADLDQPGLEDIIRKEMQQNPDAKWQQKKAREISSLLPKGSPGYWRDLMTVHDRQIFKQAAGEQLIAWNYEKDLEW